MYYKNLNNLIKCKLINECKILLQNEMCIKHDYEIDNCQRGPAHNAILYRLTEIFHLILENNQNFKIEFKDCFGHTILQLACIKNEVSIAQYLVFNLNANVNTNDYNGRTPLHLVVLNKNKHILKLLLYSGAKIDRLDCYAYTPLRYALMKDFTTIALELLKHNARIDLTDSYIRKFLSKRRHNLGYAKKFILYLSKQIIELYGKNHYLSMISCVDEFKIYSNIFKEIYRIASTTITLDNFATEINLFNILIQHEDDFYAYSIIDKFPNTQSTFNNFPYYNNLITHKLMRIQNRQKFINNAIICLKNIYGYDRFVDRKPLELILIAKSLPDDFIEKYLTNNYDA